MSDMTELERLGRAVADLRTMLRDKKEMNRLLLNNYESSDDELKQAIISALMDWNMSPPILAAVSLRDHPNKMLLLEGAVVRAIRSAGLWHSREHMPSSDGGTSGDDHAKFSEYQGWIDRFEAAYEKKKYEFKEQLNIALAFSDIGLPSEYSYPRVYMGLMTW